MLLAAFAVPLFVIATVEGIEFVGDKSKKSSQAVNNKGVERAAMIIKFLYNFFIVFVFVELKYEFFF